jgi:hypothetical protein
MQTLVEDFLQSLRHERGQREWSAAFMPLQHPHRAERPIFLDAPWLFVR